MNPDHPTFRKLFFPVFVLSGFALVASVFVLIIPPLTEWVSNALLGSTSVASIGTIAATVLTLASFAYLIFVPLFAFVYWPSDEGRKPARQAFLPLEE